MDRIKVENFLNRLCRIRALVVGDLMLDEYLWGKTERISPEAPVQVVDVAREDLRLGGAGNVLNNLVTLGCQVEVASALGEDEDGRHLRRLLEAKEIATGGVFLSPGRTTSRKTRVLASNQQMLRIDRESRDPIDPALEQRLADYVRSAAGRCQVILVSDYLKGVLTEGLLKAIFEAGKTHGIPVVVDPKGADYRKYAGATLLTPNRKEAQAASGIAISDEASLVRAGRKLQQTLDLEALVLTRSEEGMSLFLRSGEEIHLPTEAREVFDVSGAGDTVLSLIGVGLAAGLSLDDAARVSNIGAGIVVAKVGTSTVAPAEILEVVGRQHPDTDLKIKDRQVLKGVLERERDAGKKIVFTNGCFDLLHVGHVKYLQHARRLGDLLVLGLNSDDSIQRLKGPKRPLIGQEERAHVLAALKCIDYVVIFDEDTPLQLIEALRPDILVKGGDYTPEGVVGKDLVESYGGKVELIQFVDGKSTTNIIERILEQYRDA
ncbi:bifunctional protein HldE [Desulfuromonas versatilis]|uniref:Bifunctional protein HldE n=1 Tax=Desulfuromonas versatilis TaxID=2802975 RepID=A0ABM8HVQ0_9BACT|nr:bifunctional D-glycero-beta-D-manno-heptose-7-phosphate kinase/D-glycero-beta-D-manno-heptose 1-phosphate adenylyltransferase HldE [Desulfuromonas versatilis]BCR05183.1 bifunctional protein HldE [Desulfuromonas versatilis]